MTIPMDLESLRQACREGREFTYLFFWGHRAKAAGEAGKWYLSQWWPAAFVVDGITYPTAEHYMMAAKARLFGDAAAEAKILASGEPGKAKAIGRAIRGFEEEAWRARRVEFVVAANMAKFGQHPRLGAYLRKRPEDIIVEASPVDPIWGIGLSEKDAAALDPLLWKGTNLLGFALMEVRERLRSSRPAGRRPA